MIINAKKMNAWYPGSDVVIDCIDSGSWLPSLLFIKLFMEPITILPLAFIYFS